MLISNVHIIGEEASSRSILVQGQEILAVGEGNEFEDQPEDRVLRFDQAIAFPGLINSHDHLEFNLYPQLSTAVYQDYREWGLDLHRSFAEAIASISKIPETLRVRWGIYKNLLCGITTVVHQGAALSFPGRPLIDVHQESLSLNSVAFEKSWRRKLNQPFSRRSVAIHVGEGISARVRDEIDELLRWNLWKKRLIGIHGVAMTEEQARGFKALVWCPESNIFLFERTAKIASLKQRLPILFGTDSTLTATWDLWAQLHRARQLGLLDDRELYASLTSAPSRVWELGPRGRIEPGCPADLVVARKKRSCPWHAFYAVSPEDILLVLKDGQMLYLDESLAPQSPEVSSGGLARISINGSTKFIAGDIVDLLEELHRLNPDLKLPIDLAAP